MGCGLSIVADDNRRLYRKVSQANRRQTELIQSHRGMSYTKVNTLTKRDAKQSKRVAEKERNNLQKEFVTDAVNAHNEYRTIHRVPCLKFSKSLTAHAQKWADELAKKDMMVHSKCVLPNGEIIGENIYMCWSSSFAQTAPARDAVRSWYDEQSIYDYEKASFSYKTGHFTQVVWNGTKSVGIAWAKSNEGSIYVVANYRPAGNVHGMFEQNVLPPNLCIDNYDDDNVVKNSLDNDDVSGNFHSQ